MDKYIKELLNSNWSTVALDNKAKKNFYWKILQMINVENGKIGAKMVKFDAKNAEIEVPKIVPKRVATGNLRFSFWESDLGFLQIVCKSKKRVRKNKLRIL